MAINDVDTPQSDGWWLNRLNNMMFDRPRPRPKHEALWESRAQRLERLWSYYSGCPPLPEGAKNAEEAVRQFQRKARANYAALCVEAQLDRLRFHGVRTVVRDGATETPDSDVDGDDFAREIAAANAMPSLSQDVHMYRAVMGESFVIVGQPDENGLPVITAEDPRYVITSHDPARPRVIRAALKLYRDEDAGLDVAHLYLPGRVRVATRPGPARLWNARMAMGSWSWDDNRGGDLPVTGVNGEPLMPVVRFQSRMGCGLFERHTDVLDRINHMILQRMVIAVMQAFRQRALKGDLPRNDPRTGEPIDYSSMFPADPGALWRLPKDVDMWESGGVDLSPILNSVKADVQEFAACTRTPLYYLFPDAQNGSAEGASLQREGANFLAEDSIARDTPSWLQVHRLAFLFGGKPEKAKAELSAIWGPVERFSLAERGDAAIKARQSGVPVRSVLSDVWQFDPAVVKRMEGERLTDALLGDVADAGSPVGASGASGGAPVPTTQAPGAERPAGERRTPSTPPGV